MFRENDHKKRETCPYKACIAYCCAKSGVKHPFGRTSNLLLLHQQAAASVGVRQFVVPGSTVEDSKAALDLANQKPNVRCEKYIVQEE